MPTLPYTYDLDPTGVNPDNLVSGEVHTLLTNRAVRAVAAAYGGFYSESLVVYDQASSSTLSSAQFQAVELYEVPTAKFGKEVCSIILITDEDVVGPVSLTYQAVGGEYSRSATAIVNMVNALELDNRPATWPNIIGRPSEFPPAMHLHDVGDVYGFEYLVHALERIRRAIEMGDDISHDAVYRYLDQVILDHPSNAAMATAINTAMSNHLAALDPHPQYQKQIDEVRKPVILSPDANEVLSSITLHVDSSDYRSLYTVDQADAQYQIATSADFTTGVINSGSLGPVTSWDVPSGLLTAATNYYIRARYQNVEGLYSSWSDGVHFLTGSSAAVAQPTITSPVNGATGVLETPTFTSSAFAMTSGSDTHYATEWELWSGANRTGTLLWASGTNTVDKTAITLEAGTLKQSTTYHLTCRYLGAVVGASAWATSKSFTTAVFTPAIPATGGFYAGGYVAGYVRIAGQKYAIIVSPWAQGFIRDIRLSNRNQTLPAATSLVDGKANTDAMYAQNLVSGTLANGNYPAATWAKGKVINGFNDWYIPARDEMEVVYRALKPTAENNDTSNRSGGGTMGLNGNSEPVGTGYTS
jgi:hypothetical protein